MLPSRVSRSCEDRGFEIRRRTQVRRWRLPALAHWSAPTTAVFLDSGKESMGIRTRSPVTSSSAVARGKVVATAGGETICVG